MREHLHLPEQLDGKVWRYRDAARNNRRHHHAELELNLVVRGSGTYLLGARRYGIGRGDLLWLFPAQEHMLMDQSADFEMWIAVFKRKAIRRLTGDPAARTLLAQDRAGDCCRRLAERERRRLEQSFRELLAATERVALFNAGLPYALLSAWQSFEGATEVPVEDVHPAVERAARMLSEETGARSLDEIAAQAGLSATRLSRLFKHQTGMAMVQFRNRRRIDRFLSLYGTGQRVTMLNAALEAGFGSYAQFHRVFRSVMGCAPARHERG